MIAHEIKKQGEKIIRDEINKAGNRALSGIKWKLPFHDHVGEVDFTPVSVESSSRAISLTVRGEVESVNGGKRYPLSAPSLPHFDPSSSRFVQLIVSSWSLNTAAWTYFQAGKLQSTITHDKIALLNTQDMSIFAPGIAKKYGKDKRWMTARLYLAASPTAEIDGSRGVTANGDVRVEFSVAKSEDVEEEDMNFVEYYARKIGLVASSDVAFTIGGKASCSVITHVNQGNNQRLTGKINKLDLPKWHVVSSSVGDVSLIENLLDLVEYAVEKIGVPIANAFMEKGMPLPTSSHLTLKNTEMAEKNGYLLIGSDFELHL